MSFIGYIRDCIWFAKKFPRKDGSFWLHLRNVLYCNAQPKYWHGKIITKL